jgi:hypothetical protein
MDKKKCSLCHLEKDVNEFYYNKTSNAYRQPCKACYSAKRMTKYYTKKNIESNIVSNITSNTLSNTIIDNEKTTLDSTLSNTKSNTSSNIDSDILSNIKSNITNDTSSNTIDPMSNLLSFKEKKIKTVLFLNKSNIDRMQKIINNYKKHNYIISKSEFVNNAIFEYLKKF